jgi:hypothetical protein
MSILVYKDDACTQLVKSPQKFDRTSTVSPYQIFTLSPTKMSGNELAHLYKFNGTTHVKLILGTDFTISGNNITLATALGATEILIAVPNDRLNLNFGGVFGATKTSVVPVTFKREALYTYDTLLLASEDLDKTPFVQTYVDTAFTFVANQSMTNSLNQSVVGSKCTSPGLTGLTINSLEGYALVLNNTYIGKILANDVASILVNQVSYARAGALDDDLSIFSVGSLLFALDVNGSVPNNSDFAPVISLPNLDTNRDTVKVWVKDTVVIPETATNYPNMAFKLTGIEYLA